MTTRTRRFLLVALGLAAAVGCKRGSSPAAVTAYTSVDQVFAEPVFRAFESTGKAAVRAVFDTEETKSTGVLNRLIAEAKQPQADVFWSGDPVRPFMLIKRGLVERYVSPAAAAVPDAFRAKDGSWTGVAARARVLLVNKTKVPAEAMPRSIKDLANPRWAGQTTMANPLFGTTTMHVAALFSSWGDEGAKTFFADLKKNKVRIASSNGEVKRLVVGGEVAFGLTDTDDAHEAVKSGAPVEMVYPDQDQLGTLVMPTTVVLLKGSPNPDGGKKLIDYLVTAEVEAAMARSGAHMPLRQGVPAPQGVRPVSDMKAMAVDYAQVGQAMERIPALATRVGGALKLAALALRRWHRCEGGLALGASVLILLAASTLPLVQLGVDLLSAAGEVARVLSTARPWQLLGHSLALSVAVTGLALMLGIPLAVLVARTDLPGRRVLWGLHAFPMALPPFLLALGWFRVFGRQGAFGGEGTSSLLFGVPGVLVTLALAFAPVVTSLVAVALLGVDASQEEAGRVMARPLRVITRILLPAVRPAVVLAALLVFTLTISELGVPMFLRVEVFPAAVFARLGSVGYAPGEAAGLVLPLIPVVAALMAVERRLVAGRSFAVLGMRAGLRAPISLGRWRVGLSLGSWAVALWGVAPLVALAVQAAAGTSIDELASWARGAPVNSVLASGAAATIVTALGIVLGHALARRRPGGRLMDAVAMLAFITPAAVLGLGLIALWNRPSTNALYASATILVIGYVGRYAVVGVRACAVAINQIPPTLEEAAAVTGARYTKRLARIVAPAARRGIVFAWLATFVFCLRDLESAVLYYPPGGEPLTVRIFTLEANGPEAVVAGLACLHVLLTATAVGAGGWVLRKRAAS